MILNLLKSFGITFKIFTLDIVASGLILLIVLAKFKSNFFCLLKIYTKAPLSTNLRASLKPIFPTPKIKSFFPHCNESTRIIHIRCYMLPFGR